MTAARAAAGSSPGGAADTDTLHRGSCGYDSESKINGRRTVTDVSRQKVPIDGNLPAVDRMYPDVRNDHHDP